MNDIDFETRGQLAGGLTCWHRLTKIESDELVALFVQQRMALSKTEAERDAARAILEETSLTLAKRSIERDAALAEATALRLHEEGAKMAFEHVVQDKRDMKKKLEKTGANLLSIAASVSELHKLIRATHTAKGRYHTQLAMCNLYDHVGLPNVRPVKDAKEPS